jgi:hypothetical protein
MSTVWNVDVRRTVALAAAALVLAGCGGKAHETPAPPLDGDLAAAVRLCDPGEGSSLAQATACYQRRLLAVVDEADTPVTALPKIDAAVRRDGGFIFENCHLIMHWVGRNYAVEHHVSLGSLQQFLPRTNDPGCSAGFAHGMISALGKSIRTLTPSAVAAVCARSATRYQAYSCVHGLGHAYMRAYNEDLPLALRMCRRLPAGDVVDCAQGAYHDYWFAEGGADGLVPAAAPLSPRALCGRQPRRFVRACWYRAYLESPPDRALNAPSDLVAVCAGLTGLQEQGCITGASVTFRSGRPDVQLAGCATLAPPLRVSCARGVATQDLASDSARTQAKLLRGCIRFGGERPGCILWIAKALDVVTNGRFAHAGCALVPAADRALCRTGAASARGPLETFS